VTPEAPRLDGAFGLPFRSTLCDIPDRLGKPLRPCLGQVKPVYGLGETQVGIDTGNDDARIDRQDLDADKRDADVDIDYEALVQDGVDDVSEAAGRGALAISVGRAGRDGYESTPREFVDGSLASQAHRKSSTGCHGAARRSLGWCTPSRPVLYSPGDCQPTFARAPQVAPQNDSPDVRRGEGSSGFFVAQRGDWPVRTFSPQTADVGARLDRVIYAVMRAVSAAEWHVRTGLRVYHDTWLRDPDTRVRKGTWQLAGCCRAARFCSPLTPMSGSTSIRASVRIRETSTARSFAGTSPQHSARYRSVSTTQPLSVSGAPGCSKPGLLDNGRQVIPARDLEHGCH
jgi:hypothetical protein